MWGQSPPTRPLPPPATTLLYDALCSLKSGFHPTQRTALADFFTQATQQPKRKIEAVSTVFLLPCVRALRSMATRLMLTRRRLQMCAVTAATDRHPASCVDMTTCRSPSLQSELDLEVLDLEVCALASVESLTYFAASDSVRRQTSPALQHIY